MKTKNFLMLAAVVSVFLFAGWSNSYAQLKIRYINSQRVLAEYPEAKEVQKRLDEIRANYEKEYSRMLEQYEQLAGEIENQSLLLSPEKKAQKEQELRDLGMRIERFRNEKLGPQGEFYQKNRELTQPLYDKIDQVIQKIATEEEYDYVFDIVQGVVLYAKPRFDITNRVLEELTKTTTN